MKKTFSIIFLSLLFLSFFIIPVDAGLVPCGLSEDDPNQPGDQTVSCTLCHFFVMIDGWIHGLLFIFVPAVAILMIAIGGGMYIMSQGKPEMLSRAKSLFTAVAIGLLIVYGAWVIVNLFLTTIGVAEWTGLKEGWWIIDCETTAGPSSGSGSGSGPGSGSGSGPGPGSGPPPPLQLSNCTLCPGNSLGQCDRSICDSMTVNCNFVSVTLVGGQQGGICVAPNDCGACGTVSSECSIGECSNIGNQCRFIADQFGTGLCALPNDCGICARLMGGCTKQSCESIGNRCQFTPGGPILKASCVFQ